MGVLGCWESSVLVFWIREPAVPSHGPPASRLPHHSPPSPPLLCVASAHYTPTPANRANSFLVSPNSTALLGRGGVRSPLDAACRADPNKSKAPQQLPASRGATGITVHHRSVNRSVNRECELKLWRLWGVRCIHIQSDYFAGDRDSPRLMHFSHAAASQSRRGL